MTISDAYNTFMGLVMEEDEDDVISFLSHPSIPFLIDLRDSIASLSILHLVASVGKVMREREKFALVNILCEIGHLAFEVSV